MAPNGSLAAFCLDGSKSKMRARSKSGSIGWERILWPSAFRNTAGIWTAVVSRVARSAQSKGFKVQKSGPGRATSPYGSRGRMGRCVPRMPGRTAMRVPGSTYRIQCRAGVGLSDVAGSLDYLQALGITDVYLSPIALAREGSTHGYDVCDPNVLDPAVGTEAELEALSAALTGRGMGLVLDIVPNHLAADETRNLWWRSVLEEGHRSASAGHFDIDWNPSNSSGGRRVLLPILDRPYGDALDAGELVIEQYGERYVAAYCGRRFPISGVHATDLERAVRTPSADRVHEILERQQYRLAHWRTAVDEINYRRFFNIEHLVGVRVEDRKVFDDTHRWLCRLIERGVVTGIRVDHPDGLASPAEYLGRLQRLGDAVPGSLYVVVEKVLVGDEALPADWLVQGTTGYEFLNDVNSLFVSTRDLRRLERGYARFVGRQVSFERTEYDAKKQVIATTFSRELDRLAALLGLLARRGRRSRDLGMPVLRRALVELTASLPVYRTYVDRRGCRVADLLVIARALRRIVERQPAGVHEQALRFIVAIITRPIGRDAMEFVTRWQQFSSAVFAKAVEDRAFYRDNTLLSLNEVGSDRAHPGADVAAFHAANVSRAAGTYAGLLATTTHDTKLSEDVRARIHVLTECSREWLTRVDEWRRLNNRCRRRRRQGFAPDRDDEYRFYQLLIGLWPADATAPSESIAARLSAAMIKSAREAARRTNWTTPNSDYEAALTGFVERTLAGDAFVRSVSGFARNVARAGLVNSLSQTLLKIGSPGVPDFYQGTELCSLRLADPDNRQPVDTAYRQRMLDDYRESLDSGVSRQELIQDLLGHWPDGRVKLFVTAEALAVRRTLPEVFTEGSYTPLEVQYPAGVRSPEVIAFARTSGEQVAIVAAPRFCGPIAMTGRWPIGHDVWRDVAIVLPPAIARFHFVDRFTGGAIAPVDDRLLVGDLLRLLPVSLAIANR